MTIRASVSEPAAGSAARATGARFIDPTTLARIANLDLIARIVVDGFISGLHRTLNLGVSTEFAEHRSYVPGDDVRHIDWRIYARSDRLYVKTFEAETNTDLVLALDVSRSMDYASGSVSKLDYGRFVVATLAHLAARQRDRVGLATFDSDIIELVPPSLRNRDIVLHTLERLQVGGQSDFAACLRRLANVLRRRGIVVVLSDLYAPPQDIARALDELRLRGHEVITIHLLDPLERDLVLKHAGVLEDLETGERLSVTPAGLRAGYRKLLDAHLRHVQQACGARGIDYACFTTDMPLDHVLFRYLSDRARSSRVR